MSKLHNTLENIVFSMIEYNQEVQLLRGSFITHMSDTDYAKSYQTVSFNPGRQVGKTTLIARHIGQNDIAVAFNNSNAKHLENQISQFNAIVLAPVRTPNNLNFSEFVDRDPFDIVWVSDASVMRKEDIQKIYEALAGKCKQFVFLG